MQVLGSCPPRVECLQPPLIHHHLQEQPAVFERRPAPQPSAHLPVPQFTPNMSAEAGARHRVPAGALASFNQEVMKTPLPPLLLPLRSSLGPAEVLKSDVFRLPDVTLHCGVLLNANVCSQISPVPSSVCVCLLLCLAAACVLTPPPPSRLRLQVFW